MRKIFLLSLVIALFAAIVPVSAQDEASMPVECSDEEIQTAIDAVVENSGYLQEVGDAVGDGSDPAAITTAVIDFSDLATSFWTETYPTLPLCEESIGLSYNFGLVLDETVISTGMARLALFESEYGSAETASAYAGYATARAAWYAAEVGPAFAELDETGEVPDALLFGGMRACTADDEASEGMTALSDSLLRYQELGAVTGDLAPDDLTSLIGSFANLSGNYWLEVYPTLPECTEISDLGFNVGLLYDETIITLLLSRLSMYEIDYGDPDAAVALSEAAAARQELTEGWVAATFPQQ